MSTTEETFLAKSQRGTTLVDLSIGLENQMPG